MLMVLFLAASGSDQQKMIYWGKEVPDGWNGNWPAEFQTVPEKTNYEKTTSSYQVHEFINVLQWNSENVHVFNMFTSELGRVCSVVVLANPWITSPQEGSTSSYRRLGGYRAAPNYIFFSVGNRTAAVRIPAYAINEKEARVEFRMPDATGNPYLSLVAMLMAGLDGIEKKVDPTAEGFGPYEENFNVQETVEKYKLPRAPNTLQEALAALEKDYHFLTKDNVFPEELIKAWIKVKEELEIMPLQKRPHPYEYDLYYDL